MPFPLSKNQDTLCRISVNFVLIKNFLLISSGFTNFIGTKGVPTFDVTSLSLIYFFDVCFCGVVRISLLELRAFWFSMPIFPTVIARYIIICPDEVDMWQLSCKARQFMVNHEIGVGLLSTAITQIGLCPWWSGSTVSKAWLARL
jgi:hypothetical protein